jgi:hypothetical protein
MLRANSAAVVARSRRARRALRHIMHDRMLSDRLLGWRDAACLYVFAAG